MSNKNYWIRSGTYTMLQRIATFLFGFGSYFLLVRYFSIEDFGIWTLYLVVSGSVEMSRSAFIQNAFVKFFNEGEIDKQKLFTSSIVLNLISTLLFIFMLIILRPVLQAFWNSDTIGIMIMWYCATSLILIPFTQLNYLEQANHSFAGIFWSTVVRQGAFFCIVAAGYFFFPGLSLVFFASAQFLTACLGLLVAFLLTRKLQPTNFNFEWHIVKRLFKFGKYILGTGITSTVGKNADQVILGSASHSMVALYNSGVRVLNFIEIPSLSISSIVYPKIVERANTEGIKGVGILYEKSVSTILGFILPVIIGVLILPEFVLSITAGGRYVEASGILRIMAVASILIPFNIQIGSVCEVINKPHISFYINLVSNIMNVVLNIILIKYFGITGAACSFAVTVLFIFIIGQWYISSQLGILSYGVFFKLIDFYKEAFSKILKYLKGV